LPRFRASAFPRFRDHLVPVLPRIIPTQQSDPVLYPYRWGLAFGFFNALTWQVAINTPMVLFVQWLGGTPAQVGLAYSFIFVLTPVQIIATALLPRHGFRKVMLSGWAARGVFVAIPVVLTVLAPRCPGAWTVHTLVGCVFFFCLLRAIGQCAFAPWIYALLPGDASGRYFAADQYVSGIGGALTLLACVGLFAWLPVQQALFAAYAIALTGSVASYFSLRKMPDGRKPVETSVMKIVRDTPRHLFRRSLFREYLWLSVVFAVIATPVPPFSAYYLKVGPQLPAGRIMALEVCRYLGVILTAGFMQTRIERHGAKPYLVAAALAHAVIAVYWWFALQGAWTNLVGLGIAYFLVGAGTAAVIAANLNYLAKITPAEDRTLMVSVHGAVIACLGGSSAAILGFLLKRGDGSTSMSVAGFQWFFVSVFAGAMYLAWRIARLPEEIKGKASELSVGSVILRPFLSMPYVGALLETKKRKEP
jgi:MFS family permease